MQLHQSLEHGSSSLPKDVGCLASFQVPRSEERRKPRTQRRFEGLHYASLSSLRLEIHRVGGPVEEASLKGFSQILATKSAPNLEISGDMMRHGACSHMFTLFLSTRKQKASKPSYLPTRHQISCHPRIRLPSCSRSNAPCVILCQPKILQRHAKSSTGLTEYNAYGYSQRMA